MENLAVNITNLQVSFGNQLELSIDSLRVYQQDRIGIIGENGVGKSTLLKLIAGELFPTFPLVFSFLGSIFPIVFSLS